jgi:hypothetical protein
MISMNANLLISALREGTDPPDMSEAGWWELARLAESHRLEALLARRTSWLQQAPPDVARRLTDGARLQSLRSLALTRELAVVTRLLRHAGIPSIALKGPLLSWRLYGEWGLRVSQDLDVLVQGDDVLDACKLLESAGYRGEFPWRGRRANAYLQQYHDYGLWSPRGQLVELHWNWAQRRFAIPARVEEWWSESRTTVTPVGVLRFLSSEHELLFLTVHAAKHEWAQIDLVADVAMLLRRELVDWAQVRADAAEFGIARMLDVTVGLAQLIDPELRAPAADHATRRIVRIVQEHWGHPVDRGQMRRLQFDLGVRERPRDKTLMLLRTALSTTPADWAAIELPDWCFGLYGAVRVLRLSGVWRSRTSEVVEQKRGGFPNAADFTPNVE